MNEINLHGQLCSEGLDMNHGITNKSQRRSFSVICTTTLLLFLASPALAEPTRCHLIYDVEGWSILYRVARGTGQIRCADGQTANVAIVAHGGGLTLGTQAVKQGRGRFSGTEKVADLYGTYIEVGAHAGAGDGASVDARAMFNGSKRLSLAGTGSGFSLGIAFGGFTIKPK